MRVESVIVDHFSLPPEEALRLALHHAQHGDIKRAESSLREILARSLPPRHPVDLSARTHLVAWLVASRRSDEGLLVAREGLAKHGEQPAVLYDLGIALTAEGDLAAAEAAFDAVLRQLPTHAGSMSNLGEVLHRQGRLSEAEDLFREALAINPRLLDAQINLAMAISKLGREAEAESMLRRCLADHPGNQQALAGLGCLLAMSGRPAEAIPLLQRAMTLNPGGEQSRICLAGALNALNQDVVALQLLDSVVADNPKNALALLNLGSMHEKVGDYAKAIAYAERHLELAPTSAKALDILVSASRHLCRWETLERHERALLDLAVETARKGLPVDVRPFSMLHMPSTGREQRDVAAAYVRLSAAARSPAEVPMPAKSSRLRVGYMLADAREHPNGYNTQLLFGLHDRAHFEIFVYSWGNDDGSAVRRRIASDAEHFVDLQGASDETMCQRIRADQIQVLVDLMGHTQDNRIAVLARRAAPVQINYLGYPGTSGADFVDYIIGDSIVTPLDRGDDFSEKILRLPSAYQANDHRSYELPAPPPRKALGLPDDGFVFCCFNNPNKITPGRFASWMRILHQVDGSVLWLHAKNPEVRVNLTAAAFQAGIARERLIFADSAPRAAHLERLQAADLFLDTAPYGAHTTASDALWAGVPVLTVMGDTFASRVAASLVVAAGLPELIVSDEIAYQDHAIAWAENPKQLQTVRQRLGSAKAHSPLFDIRAQTKNLETAYLQAWNNVKT